MESHANKLWLKVPGLKQRDLCCATHFLIVWRRSPSHLTFLDIMVISLFPYANRVEKGKQFVSGNYTRFRTEKEISHMDKDIPFLKGEKS